ncbi:YcjF family protein [Vibrio algarum]|uniref:TIGR01620 family protein n=1 Tax=Vibrio algarum TaxID=3020714 RepID=A0ABT4YQE7_9VIBR|nr:TIGR01620 family protein [Vibrio sp. KJ40-1]MDB1123777.1 TIGR01620 family protein [Vibrio sp. KJ40-1]
MTEYKTKKIFSESIDTPKQDDDELTVQTAFEEKVKFVPAEIEEENTEAAEDQLEFIIRPNKKHKWFGAGLVVAFAGLIGWQAVDSVITAVQSSDWLSVGWSIFVASIASLGISAIGKELLKLRRLRHHFSIHEQSEELLQSSGLGKGKPFCEKLAKESGISDVNPSFTRWQKAINDSHSDAEVLQMYEGMVITKQDQQAKAIVAKLSTEAAVLVAVSPLAIADILLVAWRNFKLIDDLANVYGVELGYWSRLKLFKLVLVNMAAAGATEVATDASMDLLSMDLAGKVSARVAQGFGVGILTARLGLRAMSLLRPIPWNQESKVRLGEIRKILLVKLKNTL